ncbi:hypothetical protein V5799_017568 [Amblyomma americanum]|uniref:Secreted protein n=1 Tax=Amblyomma americanum TaxID=6943 RepID=A0AAQ4F1R0_AMBAM
MRNKYVTFNIFVTILILEAAQECLAAAGWHSVATRTWEHQSVATQVSLGVKSLVSVKVQTEKATTK